MASSTLGKRKLRAAPEQEAQQHGQEDANEIFRRHFEAQFAPLPEPKTKKGKTQDEDEDDEDDEDGSDAGSWGGLSEEDEEEEDDDDDEDSDPDSDPTAPEIEVVSHTSDVPSTTTNSAEARREMRAFLSSRVPGASASADGSAKSSAGNKPQPKTPTASAEDAPSLLKNDLALQRLLSESHLFSGKGAAAAGGGNGALSSSSSAAATEHFGRNRHLATDLRMAALGSHDSIYRQKKMPAAQRQGIAAAADRRESKRRREARENGIILERPGAAPLSSGYYKNKKTGAGGGDGSGGGGGASAAVARRRNKRDIAVDLPAVGKLRNGMLKLSKKDVHEIETSGRPPARGRKGARGGGGKAGAGGHRKRR